MKAIDIAIPTTESAPVLGKTLDRAAAAVENSNISVNQVIIIDDESSDDTLNIAKERADTYGWDTHFISKSCTLPIAREHAIDAVQTDWFWFLDDDVRVDDSYLSTALEAIAPAIGAVQGRKRRRTESPSNWVRRRSRRGGTHATLIRHDAVSDISIPSDMTVLEDEFIRRWVESNGYLWIFNHQLRFTHENQNRHPIGWEEGFIAGKYGLKPFYEVALNVPFSAARGQNPLPYIKRASGWVAGRFKKGSGRQIERALTSEDGSQ